MPIAFPPDIPHNGDVEARIDDVFGDMTHLSEPLSRIYAELWRNYMCYRAADRLLAQTELKYIALWKEKTGGGDDGAWEALSNFYFALSDKHPDACCADMLVALGDEMESMWLA